MSDFRPRRVVTGPDGFVSDGVAPNTVSATGFGVSEVLWLADGGFTDRSGEGYPLEPPPGGASSRLIRMPPTGDWLRIPEEEPDLPGMHATDTLDLMVVLEGEIVLGLEGGELALRAGDTVVQQGTRHRWKIVGDGPCTYFVTMLRPNPSFSVPKSVTTTLFGTENGSGVRRVVTSVPEIGSAPVVVQAGGTTICDVWQTGGPLGSVTQGGDVDGGFVLEPAGGGVAFRWLEIGARDWADDEGWHATKTLDVDVILGGRMALELPGGHRVELDPGDVVIQQGTDHRWLPLDGRPASMAAVMFAVD